MHWVFISPMLIKYWKCLHQKISPAFSFLKWNAIFDLFWFNEKMRCHFYHLLSKTLLIFVSYSSFSATKLRQTGKKAEWKINWNKFCSFFAHSCAEGYDRNGDCFLSVLRSYSSSATRYNSYEIENVLFHFYCSHCFFVIKSRWRLIYFLTLSQVQT